MPVSTEVRSMRDSVDPSPRDLPGIMMDAGRKRRILNEALDRRAQRHRGLLMAAALCAFVAASSSLAMRLDIGDWRYLLPVAILMAVASGSAALLLLALEGKDSRDCLAADTARCGVIIRQIQALRTEDLATEVGDRLLFGLLQEFKTIADAHKDLDGVEFVPERRHARYAAYDTKVTCTLRNGERRIATIRNMSRSGIALRTKLTLAPGTVLLIGSTPARAVRMTEDGMAFEFLKPFPRERFSPDLVL